MRRKAILWMGYFLAFACVAVARAQTTVTDTIRLQLFTDSVDLGEVVVKGHRTPAANSRWNDLQPVGLATVGGANGDLYKALQTLPGTQVEGESGRLLVRGGSSYETQTYIDGMHVLNPYTSVSLNTPARSRYSTFMFRGINLASGGAPLEYGEALSAVLPLETKDHSPVTKLGMNASVVGTGGGGTRAFAKGSVSVDLNYQNLGLYDRIFSGRRDFEKPYRMYSAASQARYTPDDRTVLKVYAQYDRTDFSLYEGDERRLFALGEDNVYFNSTFRRRATDGWEWFGGVAYSHYSRQIGGAAVAGDRWQEQQQEWHLKAKAGKRFSPTLRMEAGMEGFFRHYEDTYAFASAGVDSHNRISPTIGAGFLSAVYYPWESLKAELSCRTEYVSAGRTWNFSPRVALNYYRDRWMFSATAGRYTQLPENAWLVQQSRPASEVCVQYNVGARYDCNGRLLKAECYYKDYSRLALAENDGAGVRQVTSHGYGYSKGFDLFFFDDVSLHHFEYYLSYTYNISRRKYREYAELTTPQYATRHNASLTLKYSVPRLRTIVGVTNRFSSGRPYHNPQLPGLMNDEVKPYNSLDLGLTFLPSKKVIVHASATNILGRHNEFGRVDGQPVWASDDHFFYVGVFITLGKKAAYDVSNF